MFRCTPWLARLIAGLALALALAAQAHAASAAAPMDARQYVRYLEDPQVQLDVAAVAARGMDMAVLPERDIGAGYSRSAYWFRIRPPAGAFLVEVESPFLDQVDLYVPDGAGGYQVKRSGDARPFSARDYAHRHPVFSVPADVSEPVFLHVRSEGTIQIPLRIWTPTAFASDVAADEFRFGLYYGAMLVMIVYNAFLFLSVRDRSYLYYVGYIVTYVLFQAAINGYAPQYLWPDAPWWAGRAPGFFIGMVVLMAVVFSRKFLDVPRNAPRFDVAMRGIEMAGLACMLFVLTGPYALAAKISNYLGLALVVVVLPAGFVCLYRGYRPARWFVTAWTAFLVGTFITGLMTSGHIAYSAFAAHAMQIGSLVEVALLSLALADRINILGREKTAAQAESNLRLRQLNENLGSLVAERTAELRTAKEQAESMSQALAARNLTLEDVAAHDGLTGLLNRKAFMEQFAARIEEAGRHGQALSLLMVDIDHFKSINDRHGHQAGDRVLAGIAQIIAGGKRGADLAGRYGGEEFIVLLPHTEPEAALAAAERLREDIAALRPPELGGRGVTASIGLAGHTPGAPCLDLQVLIHRADSALYCAKRGGRNHVVYHDGGVHAPGTAQGGAPALA